MRAEAPVTAIHLSSYRVPTATFGERMAETDGTARWDSTSVLVVRAGAGGMTGLGYAYTDPVDANGAYSRKQALGMAHLFADLNVAWFEEPVSSDDLPGLRLLRGSGPPGMQVAAGEYGYTPAHFHAMLAAGAMDTIQADATRCGGVSGFLLAAAQAQGVGVSISAHTSPAIHASICAALTNVVHVEDFHDHRRIEEMFFSGLPERRGGQLWPDLTRPGHGLEFLLEGAKPYLLHEASVS